MKPNEKRMRRMTAWLGVPCLVLVCLGVGWWKWGPQLTPQSGNVPSPQSAQEPTPQPAQEPSLRDTLKGHQDWVLCVAFSPNGKQLASGSKDDTIKLWDVATGQNISTLQMRMSPPRGIGVFSLAFSPDGKTLASAGSQLKLWDVASGQQTANLQLWNGDDFHAPVSVAFSPDGKTLASGEGKSTDLTVKLWNVATGQNTATLKGPRYPQQTIVARHTSVAFRPDGKTLASGCGAIRLGSEVVLWDVATGKEKKAGLSQDADFGSGAVSLAFSPNGQTLAVGSAGRNVSLWDMATGKEIRRLQDVIAPLGGLINYSGQVLPLSFSPDGKILAAGSEGSTIKLWDMATGQTIATLEGHNKEVEHPRKSDASICVAFSPDSKLLALGSWDNTIKLWEFPSAKLVR
jgi:WD40 repeat protein